MDNYFEDEDGIDTKSLRLQTRRRKIRNIKKGQEKKLIELYKNRKALWEKERKVVYIDLVPPYQKGWKRFFVLRADVAASKQADFFAEILRKINTVEYSDRKDFKVKKRKHGRKVYVEKLQGLKQLREVREAERFTDRELQFFYPIWKVNKSGRLEKQLVFVEPWRFVLRIRPNMITQVKLLDAELESQVRCIKNHIERNHLECKIDRARSRHHGRWSWKRRYVRERSNLPQYLKRVSEEE